MKIVLVSHPTSRRQRPDFPPPGIAYLGAVAHNAGHEVLLIDGGLHSIQKIVKSIGEFSPDLIGITCWTIDRHMVWSLCEKIQGVFPDVPVIIGGPHATLFPDHVFKKTNAVAVVLGEGEETFAELCLALSKGESLLRVDGLALRGDGESILYTKVRKQTSTIDEFDFPLYKGFRYFSFDKYAGFPPLPGPTAAIISSRGCIYDCHYCSSVRFWGKSWRCRSAENVLKEIEWLVSEYSIRSLYFFDDNFPVNRDRAMAICQGMIDGKWNLSWACCSHVKMMSPEILKAMRASGCLTIDFGVESGSDVILKNINKNQTKKDIERAFSLVHDAGILPRAYLMVGSPGETEQTIDETIDLIGKIKPRASIGATLLWLLPGTAIYNEAKARGLIDDSYWLKSKGMPFNTQEHSLAHLNALRNRLMYGIAKKKGGVAPLFVYVLKRIYYAFPLLSVFRTAFSRIARS